MTEGGDWLVVHDALAIAAEGEPEGMLIRCATCTWGSVEVELECEPMLNYGAKPARWAQDKSGILRADVPGLDEPLHLGVAGSLEIEDGAAVARKTLRRGESCYCALSWDGIKPPADAGEAARRVDATVNYWRRWLERGQFPRPPVADPPAARGADAEGAGLRAERRPDRRAHHLAARGSGRRAQLGLPVLVGAGLDLRALGPPHPGLRPRGLQLHVVHRPALRHGRPGPADHVRDRRRARAHREDDPAPRRLQGRAARAGRQRRLGPAPERRLRDVARLGLHPHAGAAAGPARGVLADRPRPGRGRRRRLARARPRDLGGARRPEALRLLEAHVLGRPRPRAPGSPTSAARRTRRSAGATRPRRSRTTSSSMGSTTRRLPPALRDRRPRRLHPA